MSQNIYPFIVTAPNQYFTGHISFYIVYSQADYIFTCW